MPHFSSITHFHIFEEGAERISKCLNLVTNNQLYQTPNPSITAIGNQVQHLNGNIRQWLGEGLLKLPFQRSRSAEFINTSLQKNDLHALWQQLESDLTPHLAILDELDMTASVTIQGFSKTNLAAWMHVLEHFSYHMGQISLLTKFFTEEDLSYYGGLDLEK